jgi:hypothetical protein
LRGGYDHHVRKKCITLLVSKAASVRDIDKININVQCDPTIIASRAFAERPDGGRCSGCVRGLGRPLSRSASVGGHWYPSFTTTLLARRRIDLAPGLHWLHDRGKSGAIACRTFNLSRLRGWPFHFNLSGRLSWRPFFIGPAVAVANRRYTTGTGRSDLRSC